MQQIMDKIIILIISILIVFFSFNLFKVAFGNMQITRYMPHTHLWLIQLVSMSLIGINFMIFGYRSTTIELFDLNIKYIYIATFCIWYIMLAIPFGVIFINRKYQIKSKHFLLTYFEQDIVIDKSNIVKLYFLLWTTLSIAVVIYLCHFKVPLYLAIKGDISSLLVSRVNYTRSFEGSYFIKNVIGETCIVITSYVIFIYYYKSKLRYWKMLFLINFFCAAFISGADMSKSGLALYILPYVYIFVIIQGKISIKKFVKYIAILMVLLLLIYTQQLKNTGLNWWEILFDFERGPIGRIFNIQIQSFPTYFQIFPKIFNFTYGKGIALIRFFGVENIESARIVASVLEPNGVNGGWVGVANSLFLGDAYANFGIIGVIISPFIVSIWFCFFYHKMEKSPKTPINIGVYIVILNNLVNSITGGFCSAYLINTKMISCIIYLIIFNLLFNSFRRKKVTTYDKY